MALVSTANMVTMMGVPFAYYPPTSKQYLQLDSLRQNVESQIIDYCRWPIEQGRLPNEYKNGNGCDELPLNCPWAAYVNNVWVDYYGNYGQNPNGAFQGPPLVQGSNYALDVANNGSSTLRMLAINQMWWFSEYQFNRPAGGLAYRRGSWWPIGYGNIMVDYWYGFPSALTITGIAWNGGIATVTCSTNVVMQPRWQVTISGVSPAGYNGVYTLGSLPAYPALGNTFTVGISGNPGPWVSGGTVNAVPLSIQNCVAEGVAIALNSTRYGHDLTSEGVGGHSVSLARDADFGQLRSVLQRYRDPSTGGVPF